VRSNAFGRLFLFVQEAAMNRRTLARGLQVIGMMILPFAIASELQGVVGLGKSLMIAAGGVVVFYIGVALQGRVEP
jgi:hypothetical protein